MKEVPVMSRTILALMCFVLLGNDLAASPPTGNGSQVFHVRDFGAVPDGKTESGTAIRAAIAAAVGAAKTPSAVVEIVLEAGTYRVRPENPREPCFPVQQAANLTVRGAGRDTKIVIADPAAGGFTFGLCRNACVADLALDYDPVPFCQGQVRAVNVEAGSFDLEIEAGYPTPDAENFLRAVEPYGKWGMIIDPATHRIRSGTPDHYMTPRWEHLEGRVWRFFTAEEHYRRNLTQMRVGDAYVHLARCHGSAVLALGCDGIRIENVTVHAAPGLAVGLVGNRGPIIVRGLQVRFVPGSNRLLTTDADGVHCQQNRSGPLIENCYFEGMADDAVNIYAPPNVLREVRSATQWLVSAGCLVLPGDRLQVFDPQTGRLRGEVRAVEAKVERRSLLLTLDQPLAGAVAGTDHRSADTLYNLDACGAGFQIRGNHMFGHRRYGCLLRAGGGVVEDNVFEDTTGAGVVLANEPDWPEGPIPWGTTIRRNRFLRGGTCLGYADSPHGAALSVRPARLGHGLAEAEVIRDIIIEDNEFQDRAGTALFIGDASHVSVSNNRVSAALNAELRRAGPAIRIERSSDVVLADNTVSDARPGTTAAIEVGSDVALGDGGVRISGLNAQLHSQSQPVIDQRSRN
jgi:hypothetical protein